MEAIFNLLGYFYYDRLIRILLSFLGSHFKLEFFTSEFGPQISDIISPHRAFVLLNRYIFVCQMEAHSEGSVNTLPYTVHVHMNTLEFINRNQSSETIVIKLKLC